jgi:TonB family protein
MSIVHRAVRTGSLTPWAIGALLLHGLAWIVIHETGFPPTIRVPPALHVPAVSLVVIAHEPVPSRRTPQPAHVSAPPRRVARPGPRPTTYRPPPERPVETAVAPEPSPVVETAAVVQDAGASDPSSANESESIATSEALSTRGEDESELARYVALVRTRIDANKVYPAIARRRGVEGRVVARVRIDAAGRVLSLDTASGSSAVLGRSARDAIEAAAPFPPPPGGEFELEIPLQYSLDAG